MRPDQEIELTENAIAVLEKRYLLKDGKGEVVETPRQLFERVANFIAEADRNYQAGEAEVKRSAARFYGMMSSLEFIPNSPTLMNAGKENGQLSACFVLPVGDSMEEIFETNKHAALIHKTGGGTGFAFSRLRPKGSVVASTSGVASGPVSFMKVYNASTEAVKQGGTRRGANMGILRIDHPDILEFISCKENTADITNFNISVGVTDNFMEALLRGESYALIDPRTGGNYEIEAKKQSLDAATVFDLIVQHAWATGEPGIVFIDRMNRANPTYPGETIEATNPCGEQPLPPYDSCNLGSINLGKFVHKPLPNDFDLSRPESGIDFDRLGQTVREAIHFLDNVIDQNCYPLEQIERQTKKNRRVGLGVMGFADLLCELDLAYNSSGAFELAERLISFVESEARKQSSELAKSRGKFPNWENSIYARENVAMRNATVTTIAPTGTISIIADCSSGIEPYYALAFERNVLDGTRLVTFNRLLKQRLEQQGPISEAVLEKISSCRSIQEISELPDLIKSVFLTAADISPEEHVRMQAVFQKHTDSSVSKTINFPEQATPDQVRQAFLNAYEFGCKGVTVYRDNSRPYQVLSTTESSSAAAAGGGKVVERPAVLQGFTEKIRTGYGNLYVTVNLRDGKPFELFAQIGKSGYSTMADTEAICRLISISLRAGVPIGQIIKQLRGIGGASQIYADGAKVTSIPDAIAQVLNRRFEGEADTSAGTGSEICPDCSEAMNYDSGCYYCKFCGYSNC
ncbi:MAG: vitamin B12-dependent ribonucleotide reductase [bacterium]|nr:vitamin B12-dependent ribonucleotide reductase [bacterium]